MHRNKEQRVLLIVAALAAAPSAYSDETIFLQDFGDPSNTSTTCGATPKPQCWTNTVGNPAATSPKQDLTYTSTTKATVAQPNIKETIFVDKETSNVTSSPANFSVTPRNWDIHNGSSSVNISGYRGDSTSNPVKNNNMSGNMFGHVVTGTSLPDSSEDNYYQIAGLKLDALGSNSEYSALKLSFDFDSYIAADGDGFGVAVAGNGGTTFALLNPTQTGNALGVSAMQYRALQSFSGDVRDLTGQTGTTTTGFDGATCNGLSCSANKAGTAIFDLSAYAGQTITLRFAYASNSSNIGSSDGINIDNIKIAGICKGTDTSDSSGNCLPPPPGVPEPTSLGLAMLGLTAAAFRRRKPAA